MPTLSRLLAAAAFVTVASTLTATRARGFTLGDFGLLVALGTALHAVLLAPTLLARSEDAAGRALTASTLFLVGVPLIRSGALVNATRVESTLLLALLAIAAGGLALLHRPQQWLIVARLAAFGALVVVARTIRPEPSGKGPDVLLITVDTLRADRLGSYGHADARTPTLDALAASGARFSQAIATAPLTAPSHLAMFTGRWPISTGVVGNGAPIGDHPETLARVLSAAGWRTKAFVAGFPVSSRFGFDQGFDTFDDDFGSVRGLHDLAVVQLLDLLRPSSMPRERTADHVVDDALRLTSVRGGLFVWVHLFDPHAPYAAPAAFARDPVPRDADWRVAAAADPSRWERAYDDEIAWTDHQIGRLLEAWDAGGAGESWVIVVADHGESLGEHGVFFDHGDDLYDSSLRVPWLVRGPGIRPGTVIDAQVSTVDLAPTLLAALGVADGSERDGVSRLPELRGAAGTGSDALATTLSARRRDPPLDHALRSARAKCYARHGALPVRYDLAADPGEQAGAPAPDDPLCVDLITRVSAAIGRPIAPGADVDAALRALGYLEGAE